MTFQLVMSVFGGVTFQTLSNFFLPRRRWAFWPLLRCQLFGSSLGESFGPRWNTSSHILLYEWWEDVFFVVSIGQKNYLKFVGSETKRLQIRRYFSHRSSKNLSDGCPIPLVSSWGWWFFNSVDGVLRSHLRFFFSANLQVWTILLDCSAQLIHEAKSRNLLWRRKIATGISKTKCQLGCFFKKIGWKLCGENDVPLMST